MSREYIFAPEIPVLPIDIETNHLYDSVGLPFPSWNVRRSRITSLPKPRLHTLSARNPKAQGRCREGIQDPSSYRLYILGLYRDNGKENRSYNKGLYRANLRVYIYIYIWSCALRSQPPPPPPKGIPPPTPPHDMLQKCQQSQGSAPSGSPSS